ncbi:MAG TPA: type II toxin-antitoxin system VapC family toxin [Rubrivivax sp.]|nr:type II toxin-antitoxin system VapC family toxin [Rubrivivax sp.]HPO19132.1 type II toxin-antitoxin system VapC family toxin [Rubrivivax sp.]
MSSALLDTHALVWLVAGDDQLQAAARQRIEAAAQQQQLWISAITPWEIGMLVAKGRLVLDRDVMDWLHAALSLPGIRLAPLDPAVAVASTRLPGEVHGDPADRLIVATARALGATLITADAALLAYGRLGHVGVLAAR